MSQSIRYRFDRVMVDYIKTMEFKTVAFGGYERKDVFQKMKQLLAVARDLCEKIVEEAREATAETAASPTVPASPSTETAAAVEPPPADASVSETEELAALRERLAELEQQSELLDKASFILDEARKERDRIVKEARDRGDQELLLSRANRRAEEEAAAADLAKMRREAEVCRRRCERMERYLEEGKAIQDRFAAHLQDLSWREDDPAAE